MIKFKAKIKGTQDWIEGDNLIKESDGKYIIMKGELSWYDMCEWNSGNNYWEFIEIETLIMDVL